MKGNSETKHTTSHKIVSGGTTVRIPSTVKNHPTAGTKRSVSAKGK